VWLQQIPATPFFAARTIVRYLAIRRSPTPLVATQPCSRVMLLIAATLIPTLLYETARSSPVYWAKLNFST